MNEEKSIEIYKYRSDPLLRNKHSKRTNRDKNTHMSVPHNIHLQKLDKRIVTKIKQSITTYDTDSEKMILMDCLQHTDDVFDVNVCVLCLHL